ncbi:MAG: ASPIC/UnbV domain-containing protein, partial [Gemmatimonadota bacterium]
ADFDADGRWDLAVGQNGGLTAVFRGVGGEPGLRVRVRGEGPGNPDAIGAAVRVTYADGEGPLRELQSGSGYRSQNGVTQVFGARARVTGVRVRWPDGSVTTHPVSPEALEITIQQGVPR